MMVEAANYSRLNSEGQSSRAATINQRQWGSATWFKIRNPNHSQWIGREKLFDRERDSNPDWQFWNLCTLAWLHARSLR